jgi:hypothetical protein
MRDINRAERLLSLFTSPDSAAGIVGDLSEERGQRGSVWFWRQVLGTVLSLCRGALKESPGIVLSLVVLGFLLVTLPASFGAALPSKVVPFSLFSTSAVERVFAVALISGIYALIAWSGALIAGAALVAAASRHGMVACVVLAGILEAVLLIFGLFVLSRVPASSIWLAVWGVGLIAPLFLLLGGALLRRRQVGQKQQTA